MISPINTKDTEISTVINIELKFLVNTYAAGIIKNNKQYQVGVDKKKFVCIELASTEADSIEAIKSPIEKISIKRLLINLGKEYLIMSEKLEQFVFS